MYRLRRPAPVLLGALAALLIRGAFNPPQARADDGGRFAAIAYSASTHRYGYANGSTCLADAESRAIANCNACDATVVTEVENGWVALALSPDGRYGAAWSSQSLLAAEVAAVRFCGLVNSRVVLWASAC